MTATRLPEGMTERQRAALEADIDQALASGNFIHFLRSVKILERPQRLMKIVGGVRDMELWDHTLEIAEAMAAEQKLAIMKARQIGASWVAAAYACWLFRFHPGSLIGMFSENEKKAIRLMAKVNFIYKHLPTAWRIPLSSDSNLEMKIDFGDGVESIVTAFSAAADSGRGDDFSLVVMDEADFHSDLEDAYLSLAGSVGSTGGQMFLISTVNKLKFESVFISAYTQSPTNGWAKLFYGWRVRPGRTDAWYEKEKRAIPKTHTLTPEIFMSQENPETEREALSPANSMAVFDMTMIEYMKEYVREPIIADGPLHVYTKHQPGHRYAAGTDTAHGVGLDYSATYVIDLTMHSVVGRVMSNTMETTVFADRSITLLDMYQSPMWAIETEGWGMDVVRVAERSHYRNLYGIRRSEHGRRENGWTPTNKERTGAWLGLREDINAGAFRVPDAEALKQLKECVVVGENGKMEARKGANDDAPTAIAIAWSMFDEVSIGSSIGKTRVPRSFI